MICGVVSRAKETQRGASAASRAARRRREMQAPHRVRRGVAFKLGSVAIKQAGKRRQARGGVRRGSSDASAASRAPADASRKLAINDLGINANKGKENERGR